MEHTHKRAIAYYTDGIQESYWTMLTRSMRSLRKYTPDTPIILYSPNQPIYPIPEECQPCEIRVFPRVFDYFLHNKCLVCQIDDYEEVILIDADTFIFNDVNPLFTCSSADVSIRLDEFAFTFPYWKHDYGMSWLNNFKTLHIPILPPLNTGLVVFRRGILPELFDLWKKYLVMMIAGELTDEFPHRFIEDQSTFPLVISSLGLNFSYLDRFQHSYGFLPGKNELSARTIVFHTGSREYNDFSRKFGLDPIKFD